MIEEYKDEDHRPKLTAKKEKKVGVNSRKIQNLLIRRGRKNGKKIEKKG